MLRLPAAWLPSGLCFTHRGERAGAGRRRAPRGERHVANRKVKDLF